MHFFLEVEKDAGEFLDDEFWDEDYLDKHPF